MKNWIGAICGFLFGMAGFLAVFTLFVLDRIPPSDELAPGITVLLSIVSGGVLACVGRSIQRRLMKNSIVMESHDAAD